MKKLLCGLLGLVSVSAFAVVGDNDLNYQERGVYYSEKDNVCNTDKGSRADVITLDVQLPNSVLRQYKFGDTSVGCDTTKSKYYNGLTVQSKFHYFNPHNDNGIINITFNDATQTTSKMSVITSRVQRTTIANPVTIEDKIYNCNILGSGKVEHFGDTTIAMVCTNAQ